MLNQSKPVIAAVLQMWFDFFGGGSWFGSKRNLQCLQEPSMFAHWNISQSVSHEATLSSFTIHFLITLQTQRLIESVDKAIHRLFFNWFHFFLNNQQYGASLVVKRNTVCAWLSALKVHNVAWILSFSWKEPWCISLFSSCTCSSLFFNPRIPVHNVLYGFSCPQEIVLKAMEAVE